MFAKSYRLKTSTALKNSEKKHLAQRIQHEFPNVTDENAKELIPNKSVVNCLKIVTSSGDTMCVYAADNLPIVIEAHDKLYPTVCALWKVPDMVPTITIHEPVIDKLKSGVPLYVPGVVVPQGGRGFPLFPMGATVAVNSDTNRAAAAVGKAMMSSADMLMRSAGMCMETLHVLGDFLCREQKFHRIERPELGPASYGQTDATESVTINMNQMTISAPKPKEHWPTLGGHSTPSEWPSLGGRTAHVPTGGHAAPITTVGHTAPITTVGHTAPINTVGHTAPIATDWPNLGGQSAPITQENQPVWGRPETQMEIQKENDLEENGYDVVMENGNDDEFPSDMDELLRFCLLSFLKLEGKKTPLPLRLNLLYRNHMVPLCPPNRTLDVKKSSYKKMGKFMEAMQKEGLVQVKLIEKGVDAVTGIDLSHPSVKAHYVPEAVLTQKEEASREPEDPEAYVAPVVREMYAITANILDLFAPLRKGTLVTAADIRSTITDYVKRHNLQSEEQKGQVRTDPVLAKIAAKEGLVSWEELNTAVQGKMTACTEMRFADGTVRTNKSRLEPIKMNVATRSGNKKVTLVSNLEAFGFSLPALGKACQHGLSVSSTVTRTAGSKYDQLMVQGDQTYFITKMLIEKYHIPKKFIDGADKMLKKKK